MSSFWLGSLALLFPAALVSLFILGLYLWVRLRLLYIVLRIFQEKPLFVIPRGLPREGAEDLTFPTSDGLALRGCYLKTSVSRKGVILFGLEYGSNRWSCQAYCEPLLQAGYDIFAFEPRNQGDSDGMEGYEPLQWVTRYETDDTEAALRYLKSRRDADPKGFGFFGISKGGGAGLIAAASDPAIRCLVTDGAFGTYSTMIPYMRKWVSLYSATFLSHGLLPSWFYGLIAVVGIRKVEQMRHAHFPHLESAMPRLKRPLLMIHGGGDTYIRPEMARSVFDRAAGPKVFWVVPGAKHNQAIQIAGDEYSQRVVAFFDLHLAGLEPATEFAPVVESEPILSVGAVIAAAPA